MEFSIFITSVWIIVIVVYSSIFNKPRSLPNSIWASSSAPEPKAILETEHILFFLAYYLLLC